MIYLQYDNLGTIERKVLGALMILADKASNNTVKASMLEIAELIGYKATGGALSFAIKVLERDNYLVKIGRSRYQLLGI